MFESTRILRNAMTILTRRCVVGITANREYCLEMVKRSLGIVTALVPYIGYDRAAGIAQEAFRTGKSVYDVALQRGILSREKLDELLSPERMVKPRRMGKGAKPYREGG